MSGAAKFPAHRSAPFTGVSLTAPFPLRRPPAPAPLTLHLIFWTPLTSPLLSFDFWPAPLRSEAGFKGGRSGPQISLPTAGLPLHLLIFLIFRRYRYAARNEKMRDSYRPTDKNMITLNKTLSYKITKCILFTNSHIVCSDTWAPGMAFWIKIWRAMPQAFYQLNMALLHSQIL